MSFGGYGLNPNGPSATGQKQSSGMNAGNFLSQFGKLLNKSQQGQNIPEGYDLAQISNFTPEMMQLFQQWIESLGPESFTSQLAQGNPDIFAQLEAPALKQFNELQGGLASRFSGLGGQGALSSRKSSGFQNSANQAAKDFAQQLQSQRIDLQNQATKDMGNMYSQLLNQRPYEKALIGEKEPAWAPFLNSLAQGAGRGIAGGF